LDTTTGRPNLHLIANEQGEYNGSSANLSGEGFAGMRFKARATSEADFDKWVTSVKNNGGTLSISEYEKLAQPTKDVAPITYASKAPDLYNNVLKKYMSHPEKHNGATH
jgi:cytochrome o ubiquinol oxidase subunit II